MKKINLIGFIVIIFLVNLVSARTPMGPPDSSIDFLVDGWDRLPFKDIRYNGAWVDHVNSEYGVSWSKPSNPRAPKCLSYSAATTNDWFKLMTGTDKLSSL